MSYSLAVILLLSRVVFPFFFPQSMRQSTRNGKTKRGHFTFNFSFKWVRTEREGVAISFTNLSNKGKKFAWENFAFDLS